MKNIFLILFICFSLSIFSQVKHKKDNTIDTQLSKCLGKENISNAEMCNCEIKAREDWDKELNKYYNLLKAKLPKKSFEILKESQRQWIIYREKEFVFISNLYYEVSQGTMWYAVAEDRKTELVKARVLELIEYYKGI